MENTNTREILFKLVALVAVLVLLYGFFRVFDIRDVRASIEGAGVWAPLILVLAKASTIIIAPLTGSPIYPVAGALFGFWKGFFLLVIGDMLGGAVAFYLSRSFGRGLVERMLGSDKGLIPEALAMMSSVRGFFLARLCFTTFPEVPAFVGGLSRVPFIPFIVIYTSVGMVPTAFTTALGTFLSSENDPFVFGAVMLFGALVSGVSFFVFMRMLKARVDNSAAAPPTAVD